MVLIRFGFLSGYPMEGKIPIPGILRTLEKIRIPGIKIPRLKKPRISEIKIPKSQGNFSRLSFPDPYLRNFGISGILGQAQNKKFRSRKFPSGSPPCVSRSNLGLKSIFEDAGTRTRDLSTKHAKQVRLSSALRPRCPERAHAPYIGARL